MQKIVNLFNPIALFLAIMVLTVPMLTSCNSDDPGTDITNSSTAVIYNIVTYEGTTDDNVTTFTFRESDDKPLITLTAADWAPTKEIDPGTRLLLAYTAQKVNTSGSITVLSAQLIYGGTIGYDSLTPGTEVATDPIWLNSLWRDGSYINVDCKVDYAVTPARFSLVADTLTIHDDFPDLYLIHESGAQFSEYSRRIYASWDIDSVWQLPTCQGVTIHFRDSNRNLTEATFSKDKSQLN
jgi:hypothetical protein